MFRCVKIRAVGLHFYDKFIENNDSSLCTMLAEGLRLNTTIKDSKDLESTQQ